MDTDTTNDTQRGVIPQKPFEDVRDPLACNGKARNCFHSILKSCITRTLRLLLSC